ncbi:MAG: hypothetical protein LUO93_12265, partial [Methanomicrobiales archaeon]|nr:hypothetical protein [Methanomicrobiales archaeon]
MINLKEDHLGQACLVAVVYLAIAVMIVLIIEGLSSQNLAGVDGQRFHAMAEAIISGLAPYVDFVDPKPPLIYFIVTLVDLVAPAGGLDIPLMAGINVLSALLIWHLGSEEYGSFAGFTAGAFYLVTSVFVQGYFLFSEQFVVLFLILALLAVRTKGYWSGGLLVGLAFGFKQYALLGALPLLYLMRVQGSRKYHEFLAPLLLAAALPFLLIYFFYGSAEAAASLHWTFGIGLAYLSGSAIAEIPNYHPDTVFAFALNIIASIAFVLPTLMFAGASVIRRGIRTPFEGTVAGLVIVFAGTLLIR